MHLILANPPWRQLQERAEKIPGEKKHVGGILSQSQCAAQFNTAQNRVTGQLPVRSRGSKIGHAPTQWASLRWPRGILGRLSVYRGQIRN